AGAPRAYSRRPVKAYYDRRAAEYDDWWLGTGLHAARDRPGWAEEVEALVRALASLPPARTLDVACGTGFLTRHLPGEVVGLDQSQTMLDEAQRQAPDATYARGDALELPFSGGAFERIFTAHFYGHLEQADRAAFVRESRPVVQGYAGQQAYMLGQAPGIVEGEERRPWRGRAGRTLRRWLDLDEEQFYGTFYCASVTRCYPGRAPSGRGDRTPTPREQ